MNGLIIGVALWVMLAAAVVTLVIKRNALRRKAEETVTLAGGQLRSGKADAFEIKAERLDKWINVLAGLALVSAFALLVYWAL